MALSYSDTNEITRWVEKVSNALSSRPDIAIDFEGVSSIGQGLSDIARAIEYAADMYSSVQRDLNG